MFRQTQIPFDVQVNCPGVEGRGWCDNWPVLWVPQFIGSEKLVVYASLGLNDSKISCVDLHQSGGRYDEKFVITVSAGDYHCDRPRQA